LWTTETIYYHINMIKHSIRYFNNKEIRAVWDNEKSMWWNSALFMLNSALTNDINNRELFMKGIDTSYSYEEEN